MALRRHGVGSWCEGLLTLLYPTHIINKSAGVGGGTGDPGKSALKTLDFTGFRVWLGPGWALGGGTHRRLIKLASAAIFNMAYVERLRGRGSIIWVG